MQGRRDCIRANIAFEGREIGSLASYYRARGGIGYVPQTRDIFHSLTVERICSSPPSRDNGIWTAFMNCFRISAERRNNGGHEISGGEQQMLSIGRALMGNPRLLLLDEPMEGLAPVVVEKLFDIFVMLRNAGNFGIIFVEQYVDLALNFAPRTIVLDRGRIICDGRSADLADDAEKVAAYFGASGEGSNVGKATVRRRTIAALRRCRQIDR